jgi:transcriptional regulator with XRE-family HTH domain
LEQLGKKPGKKQVQPASGPEKAFGQVLREIRQARKLSQEQLGFDAGFDRTYISLLERGIRSPTLRAIFRLADVLDTPSSVIIQRTEALVSQKPKRGVRS